MNERVDLFCIFALLLLLETVHEMRSLSYSLDNGRNSVGSIEVIRSVVSTNSRQRPEIHSQARSQMREWIVKQKRFGGKNNDSRLIGSGKYYVRKGSSMRANNDSGLRKHSTLLSNRGRRRGKHNQVVSKDLSQLGNQLIVKGSLSGRV